MPILRFDGTIPASTVAELDVAGYVLKLGVPALVPAGVATQLASGDNASLYSVATIPSLTVQAVATANVALTGIPASGSTDGVTLTAGQTVLLPAQTTASENGPWVVASGAWARPAGTFAAGATISASQGAVVTAGTVYAGLAWYLPVATSLTVGTSPQAWKSTATVTPAVAGPELLANKGQPSGYPELDSGGHMLPTRLPTVAARTDASNTFTVAQTLTPSSGATPGLKITVPTVGGALSGLLIDSSQGGSPSANAALTISYTGSETTGKRVHFNFNGVGIIGDPPPYLAIECGDQVPFDSLMISSLGSAASGGHAQISVYSPGNTKTPQLAIASASTLTLKAGIGSDGATSRGLGYVFVQSPQGFVVANFTAAVIAFQVNPTTTGPLSTIGFFGKTPVVQQTLAAAASDAATTQTLANSLRTALANLGLGA